MTVSIPTAASSAPRIEDYLDHVCAPLVGVVPYDTRQQLRIELRSHLEALADGYRELGQGRQEAVVCALEQFGDPDTVGRRWAREWGQSSESPQHLFSWRTSAISLACFGAATLSVYAWSALSNGCHLSFAWLPVILYLQGIVLPLCAGFVTGRLAREHPITGALVAIVGCIALNSLVDVLTPGSSKGPMHSMLSRLPPMLALMQATLWLPLGCGAAALGNWLRDRRERRPNPSVLQQLSLLAR